MGRAEFRHLENVSILRPGFLYNDLITVRQAFLTSRLNYCNVFTVGYFKASLLPAAGAKSHDTIGRMVVDGQCAQILLSDCCAHFSGFLFQRDSM